MWNTVGRARVWIGREGLVDLVIMSILNLIFLSGMLVEMQQAIEIWGLKYWSLTLYLVVGVNDDL